MGERLIYINDVHSGPYEKIFNDMKAENNPLYLHLVTQLERSSSVGIPEDILRYLGERVENIPKDEKYLYHLVNFACNPIITVKHLAFVDEYFNQSDSDHKFPIDDFAVVFSACVDKGIPLEEIKRLLYSGRDVVDIYEIVDTYDASTSSIDDMEDGDAKDLMDVENYNRYQQKPEVVESIDPSSEKTSNTTDVDMFNSLVTLISSQNKDDISDIGNAQVCFSEILKKLQAITSDVSVFSTDFINAMKKDKEEIKRLDAMIKLMQNLLASKEQKINELRGELVHLNERIRNFESAELRQDALNQKIREVYHLANDTESLETNEFVPMNR